MAQKEKEKEILAQMNDEYLKPSPDRNVDQTVLKMVADYVVPKISGRRVLELGVGDQVWTPMLVDRLEDVTTLDGSEELLLAMKTKLGNCPWTPVVTFFEDYTPKQRFDTVLATYVLEHVDDPALILNLAREKWLNPGGTVLVVVPQALSLHRRLAVEMGLIGHVSELGETDFRMGHKRCLTCHEMERIIVEAGFRVQERQGLFLKPFPNALLTQCSEQHLRGLFDLGLQLPIEYSAAVFLRAMIP